MASKHELERVYEMLNQVTPDSVYYALYVADNTNPPFIVYQQVGKRTTSYADDLFLMKLITIQITLVTKSKDFILEKKLEQVLTDNHFNFNMINEYYLVDTGLYRVYEIKMEEFIYE